MLKMIATAVKESSIALLFTSFLFCSRVSFLSCFISLIGVHFIFSYISMIVMVCKRKCTCKFKMYIHVGLASGELSY